MLHSSVWLSSETLTAFPSFSLCRRSPTMETSNTDQTASSPHSQASTPLPTPHGRSPHPTTPGKGCPASRAPGSTHPQRSTWGSITR